MNDAAITRAAVALEQLPEQLRRDSHGYPLEYPALRRIAKLALEAIADTADQGTPDRDAAVGELDLLATIDELEGLASNVDEAPTRGQLRTIIDTVLEADAAPERALDAELEAMASGTRPPSPAELEALAHLALQQRPPAGRPILSVLVRQGWARYDATVDGWVLTDAGRKVLDEEAGR